MSAAGQAGVPDRAYVLRLYVAGELPNSSRALANLQSICRAHLESRHTLEVIDALEQPRRALSDGVVVAPTLLRLAPQPLIKIIGDLSDLASVLLTLEDQEKHP
jgi:circadian clock protein KaiB